jgi:hypothetical protein
MRFTSILVVLGVALPLLAHADTPRNVRRDKALRGITACQKRNWIPSRQCRDLNKNVTTLVDIYRQGDKTVLPTLLRFTYLTEFYGEALTSDPEGFLAAVSQLKESDQRAVAAGFSGREFGIPKERFDSIRGVLNKIPSSSPNFSLARMSVETLETDNAVYLLNYFPSQTFEGRAADFEVRWYSREFHVLGQRPLWPTPPGRTYRITVLPSFSTSESAALTILPDSTGQVEFRKSTPSRDRLDEDITRPISSQQVADFTAAIRSIGFWEMPTKPPPSGRIGLDGSQWILEGTDGVKYHIVDRWCPQKTPFWETARNLFDLAGHKLRGPCGGEY